MAKNLQFLNVNIYVITFFIDIFVVFVCIHRYVKLNSGKVVNLDYVCVFVYLLTKSLVHLTPLKTIVISTKDGCPTLLANDGYFGQACTLFYFYSCLFCKFKLIKGANKVVVVVVVILKKR